jgi:hypothetical protein
MIIDEYDFEKTAQAVFIMNPSARERYTDWQGLKSFMVSMAYQYCYESNSFSTSGFCLTAFNGSDGERNVKASVQGFTAAKFVQKLQEILNIEQLTD